MNGVPRITEVKPLDNMVLMVTFDNDVKMYYDVKHLVNRYPVFRELNNKSIFDLVHVDCGGFGIAWTDDIDLSEYEIWDNGSLA